MSPLKTASVAIEIAQILRRAKVIRAAVDGARDGIAQAIASQLLQEQLRIRDKLLGLPPDAMDSVDRILRPLFVDTSAAARNHRADLARQRSADR